MRIRVFHNVDYVAMNFGYNPTHAVVEVYAYDDTRAAGHHAALHAAVARFTIGHADPFGTPDRDALAYRQRHNRSLDIGDVLACDDNFYARTPTAWQPIAPPRVITLAQTGTTPLASPDR